MLNLGLKSIAAHSARFIIKQTPLQLIRSPTLRCCAKQFSISSASLTERRYSAKHEWVSLRGDVGTIGISSYAQEALGDVVYVQLPDIGSEVSQNDEVGAVESVKAASEIYTPVSGKVAEVNLQLEDKPGLVNTSSYEDGWLFKLHLSKPEEYKALMDENQYQAYLKEIKH
ncbi:Glycine cleavage system H protein, mitochondrial [Halotydeus destructor]|nr:Glycine cleavage system H protein, mitochondrial [Halotydeus destructor]